MNSLTRFPRSVESLTSPGCLPPVPSTVQSGLGSGQALPTTQGQVCFSLPSLLSFLWGLCGKHDPEGEVMRGP